MNITENTVKKSSRLDWWVDILPVVLITVFLTLLLLGGHIYRTGARNVYLKELVVTPLPDGSLAVTKPHPPRSKD